MHEILVWIVGGVVPLIFCVFLVGSYARTWLHIKNAERLPIGEPIRIPAWANLRRDSVRVLSFLSFVSAGGVALLPFTGIVFEKQREVTIFLLILGEYLHGTNALMDWIDDRRLIEAVRAWDQHYVAVPKDRHPKPAERGKP